MSASPTPSENVMHQYATSAPAYKMAHDAMNESQKFASGPIPKLHQDFLICTWFWVKR